MKYSAPRGTVDVLADTSGRWQKLEELLRGISAAYNVKETRTPVFENTELFVRSVGDTSDVVTKEMYTFEDKGHRSLTLRPEGTAGMARAYVEHKLYALPEKLQKLYYMGPMFRYERPQAGRQRQFHQYGVEMLGVESPYVDVECMMMAMDVVKALGLEGVTLHVNSLGDDASRDAYREALKDHFRPHLGELCHDCNARFDKNPLRILDCKTDRNHPAMKTAPKTIDYLSDEAKAHFDAVIQLLDALNVDYVVDTNLVRGLDYYSHTVFEIISDDPRLGAGSTVGGGGRYNGLIEELGGPATPGVGFAFGMERLLLAMGDDVDGGAGLDAYVMPLGDAAKKRAVTLIRDLRAAGLTCDMDFAGRGLKGQFKSADRFKAAYALILGESELEGGYVNIRNNNTKDQVSVGLDKAVAYLLDVKEGKDGQLYVKNS